jgi:hypothetical protein
MVDTARPIATLVSLLADNAVGEISAQDIRDLLVSLVPSIGSFHVSTPVETVISVQSTYVKVLGTTTAGAVMRDFTMTVNNRLRYDGVPDRLMHVVVSGSFTPVSADTVGFKLAKDGVVIDETDVRGEAGMFIVVAPVLLSSTEFIELWVANHDSTDNLTVDFANFVVTGHIV